MKLKPFLKNITEALKNDNFEIIDSALSEFYTHDFGEQDVSKIEEILTEITLYSELKEDEYKEKALELLHNI